MASKYPKDQFDVPPDSLLRVGAHRAPRKKSAAWIAFAWAALAVVVLVIAGVAGLFAINGSINFKGALATSTTASSAISSRTPHSTPTPTVTPTMDPNLIVTVLNGTTTGGLAGRVGDTLRADGWKVDSVANASESNLTQTTVYYSDAKNEGAALGLAKAFPGATVSLTQVYAPSGADLTVVVGSDYKEPGQ